MENHIVEIEYTDDAYTQAHGLYKGSYVRVQKFYTFDCYDILPALKQEVQFEAHEFHLGLVLSLMSKADAQ